MKRMLLFSLCCLAIASAKSQIITTVAGNGSIGYGGDGGQASTTELNYPNSIAVDSLENLYISDSYNYRIRKVEYKTGTISTIGGNGISGYSGDGGQATSAELNPSGVTLDRKGNLYVSDNTHSVIRRINLTTGIITTIAGNGIKGFSGDVGPASSAELDAPSGIAINEPGNLFFADAGNYRIREINIASGIITTIAGNGYSGYSGDGGPATSAEFWTPAFVAIDKSENMYVSDNSANVIRKIDSSGNITTIAGNGLAGFSGDGGPGTNAELFTPLGVAVDDTGNIYISDALNNRIRKINNYTGIINTIAGTVQGFSGDGGNPLNAELDYPVGISLDNSGNMYICDENDERVREIWQGPIAINVNISNPFNCSVCNGTVSVNVSNGYQPYTYQWSQGGTNSFVSGLCTGYDSLTVTDSLGFSIKQVITIGHPVSDAISSTMSNCANNTGIASVLPIGGVSPFSILWSNGETSTIITGLSSGTYSVTITDSLGCSKNDSVFVPLGVMSTTIQTNFPKCNAPTDGEAMISSVGGGIPPYTYYWSPMGGNGLTATGLTAGGYTVTITDANGCTGKDSITITQPAPLVATFGNSYTNYTCSYNFEIQPTVTDGTPPYSYLWQNGSTYDTTNFYFSGIYSITVTDAYGCVDTVGEDLINTEVANSNITLFKNVTCYGGNNGGVVIFPEILKDPTVTWYPTGTNWLALSAGTYTVVIDNNDFPDCRGALLVTITQPQPITIISDSLADNGSCNGKAWATVGGGTSPYNYLWTGGLTTDTISNQCAGYYCMTITDFNGCADSDCLTIPLTIFTGDNVSTNSSGIEVYPNPNNGIFTIVETGHDLSVEIYNVLGEKVFSQFSINHSQFSIDLRSKSNGVYFYRIVSENGKAIGEGKVVIQK